MSFAAAKGHARGDSNLAQKGDDMARHSSTLKQHLWRFAMHATPFPFLARPRGSDHWQGRWRERQPAQELRSYANSTPLKVWFAEQIVQLSPSSVLELGCNVGGNLREISAIDPKVELNGIELNEQAIALGKSEVVTAAHFIQGSMANAAALFDRRADVVFTSAAAMHCDDDIFGSAKTAALKIALKAIVHLEFHAWTPADLINARNWRSTFLSDRWMRDYIGEYQTHPRVESIEAKAIPFAVNPADNIGRVRVNDVTGLIIVKLKS